MANALKLELLAGAERLLTGQGAAIDIGTLRRAARIDVSVGSVIGAAAVQVAIETRSVDTAPWREVSREIWNAGANTFVVDGLERYVRATWTADAGLTVFLTVGAEAHVLYCTPGDITRFALPERATEGMSDQAIIDACIAISELADGYLGGSYSLPLSAWGIDLRMQSARCAAALLLTNRGVDPEGPDALIFTERNAAVKWFERIADGKLKPAGMIDTTPEEFEGGSVVLGSPARGW
jgi:hypothetical protein